jgi:hypothetical protein
VAQRDGCLANRHSFVVRHCACLFARLRPNALAKLRRVTIKAPVSGANRRPPQIGDCFSVR